MAPQAHHPKGRQCYFYRHAMQASPVTPVPIMAMLESCCIAAASRDLHFLSVLESRCCGERDESEVSQSGLRQDVSTPRSTLGNSSADSRVAASNQVNFWWGSCLTSDPSVPNKRFSHSCYLFRFGFMTAALRPVHSGTISQPYRHVVQRDIPSGRSSYSGM